MWACTDLITLLHEKGVGFDQHDRVCKAAVPAYAVEGITLQRSESASDAGIVTQPEDSWCGYTNT